MSSSPPTKHWPSHALGAFSLAGYWILAVELESSGGASDVHRFLGISAFLFILYLVAAYRPARRGDHCRGAGRILVWAVLFRLTMLPAGLPTETWRQDLATDIRSDAVAYRSFLLYDNDVWRYLWDGHVFDAGLNPYARSPAELEAAADAGEALPAALFDEELWYDIFDRVSYETYHTVYPPAAQWLFRLLHRTAPGSVFAWKLILVLLDVGTCVLLAMLLRRRGGRPSDVVLYAWNPLAIKEIAGSGHVDALLIFFLVLSIYCLERRWQPASLAIYGLAVLSKITPILLLGLYLKRVSARSWWVLAATLAAGYLPFLGSLETMVRGLLAFAREWVFNPGPWLLSYWIGEQGLSLDGRLFANSVSLAVTAALVARTAASDDGSFDRLISGGFLILGGFLIWSAAVMPWYLLWVLPLAVLRSSPNAGERRPEIFAWIALTALSLLSYLIYIDQVEHRWWLWVEYLGFFAALIAGCRRTSRRDGLQPAERPGVRGA